MDRFTEIVMRHPYWLSLLMGGISATGFAPLGWWPLTLVALALWMVLIQKAPTKKAAFTIGWIFGLGHFVVGLNWIAKAFTFQSAMPGWLGYVAVVLLSLYLAIYPGLAALGAWMLGKDRPLVLTIGLAGTWIITEWLRSWVFSGFIWSPLSAIWLDGAIGPLWLRWIGSYGSSGLLILIVGFVVLLIRQLVQGKSYLPNVITEKIAKNAIGYAEALGYILLLVAVFLIDQFSITKNVTDSITKITIVQPNIGQQDKWKSGYEAENLQKLADLTIREDDEPRLIFWPEAAIPDYLEAGYPSRYYYGRPPEFVRQQLASMMKPGDVLVLGALKLEFEEADNTLGQKAVGARNSVFAMDADRELLGRYDKSHLVPYGEYLPMRPVLEAIGLSRLAPGDFDFWPGPGARSLDLGAFGKMGLQICYEIIFSGQVVDGQNRPGFIFNPSNDAWFGSWGPPQHLAQARLRAIEEGLPVIRSTPTGISAVIDADGKVMASIPMGEAGRIDTNLPSAKAPTLFARHGNILPLGFALILLICAIAIRSSRR